MACGIIAVLYGIITSRQVLSLSQWQSAHDGGFRRHPGRRGCLFETPVHDDCDRRHHCRDHHRLLPEAAVRRRVPHRRDPFRLDGLHRHEHIGPCKRPHRGGRSRKPAEGPHRSLPGGCSHRPSCRRACPPRDYSSVLVPHRPWRLCSERPGGRQCAHRSRTRGLARLHLRASRRRHLHQGRRRRR